jgi:hypothetical protein
MPKIVSVEILKRQENDFITSLVLANVVVCFYNSVTRLTRAHVHSKSKVHQWSRAWVTVRSLCTAVDSRRSARENVCELDA